MFVTNLEQPVSIVSMVTGTSRAATSKYTPNLYYVVMRSPRGNGMASTTNLRSNRHTSVPILVSLVNPPPPEMALTPCRALPHTERIAVEEQESSPGMRGAWLCNESLLHHCQSACAPEPPPGQPRPLC